MSQDLVQFSGVTHPLKSAVTHREFVEGMSVAEILLAVQPEAVLMVDAHVFINDTEIPREMWHRVYPKKGAIISARIIPYLRGGETGKQVFRVVAIIAILVVAGVYGAALGSALGFSTSAIIGGVATNVALAVGTTIISVAGYILLDIIAPIRPPKGPEIGDESEESSRFLSAQYNRGRQFSPVPIVLGYYRFRPPYAAQPFSEPLGDSNRLRLLYLVSQGEVRMSDWRIGLTPITNFTDYRLEERLGTETDAPITIYTNQIRHDELSALLVDATPEGVTWVTRTGGRDADEISLDISFPRGLVQFHTGNGQRQPATVWLYMEYRIVGTNQWISPLLDPEISGLRTTMPDVYFNTARGRLEVTASRTAALRHGISWKVPRGQYEIRVAKGSYYPGDPDSVQHETRWAALKTITDDAPINYDKTPLALAALDIRATDQISGSLNDLSVYVQSVCPDWDRTTQTWIKRATNNPASLFRYVLEFGGGAIIPVEEIDLEKLQEWHEFCDDMGFSFNMIRDFATSIFDVLADVASAGRASVDNVDGKWSVLIDKPTEIITTMITPRNSSGFTINKAFVEAPHAWRIQFPNEDLDYGPDELFVYRAGYDETNATLFELLPLKGITDAQQIVKLGRYYGAVVLQRAERWTVTQDFEYLIARRGSRVRIMHDVMINNSIYGRLTEFRAAFGPVNYIVFEINTALSTGGWSVPSVEEDPRRWGITVRSANPDTTTTLEIPNWIRERPFNNLGGISSREGNSIVMNTFTAPFFGAPQDVIDFGITLSEIFENNPDAMIVIGVLETSTEDAIVLTVEPQSDLSAKLTLAPYRGDLVYADDNSPVPPYVPVIPTPIVNEPVKVVSVETGRAAALIHETTIEITAEITIQPPNRSESYIEIQQRLAGLGEPYYTSYADFEDRNTVRVRGLATAETWDFRLRIVSDDLTVPGNWTYLSGVRIEGLSEAPEPLLSPTINTLGNQAFIRWSTPPDIDAKSGAVVVFRHADDEAVWSSSVSIGQSVRVDALQINLPLKPGFYLARVINRVGTQSEISIIETIQSAVLEYDQTGLVTENPTFAGEKTNTAVIDGSLRLVAGVLSGEYEFQGRIGYDVVKRVRLTTSIAATSVSDVNIDELTDPIDTWPDLDGAADQAGSDVQVWVRYTDEDPAGANPKWSEYQRLESDEMEGRAFEFEARLFTNTQGFNIFVTRLSVKAEEVM